MTDPQPDDEQAPGILKMLLGALFIIVVMVGSTLLLIPRLLLHRAVRLVRPAPARPEGFGERPVATPPDAAAVVRRARLLALQLEHLTASMATLSGASPTSPLPDVTAALAELRDAATRDELAFLGARPGSQSKQALFDASWRAEALTVLLWALGRLDAIPDWDTQVDPERLLAQVRALATPAGTSTAAAAATLRPQADIEAMQRLALLWHWRSRTRQLEEDETPLPEQLPMRSYEELVRVTVDAAVEDGAPIPVRDGDFKAMGKAFRWLTDDEWSSVRSIIVERHHALNWLLGYAPDNRWDETPTHT